MSALTTKAKESACSVCLGEGMQDLINCAGAKGVCEGCAGEGTAIAQRDRLLIQNEVLARKVERMPADWYPAACAEINHLRRAIAEFSQKVAQKGS